MKSKFDVVLQNLETDRDDNCASNLITLREAARLVGLSQPSVRRLIETGRLPGGRVGGAWRVPKREFCDAISKMVGGAVE